MRRLFLSAFVLSGLLGGCKSDSSTYYDAPKPLDKMSPEELCAFYAHYRDNPDLSQQSKDLTTQRMRAKGCQA